MTTPIHNAEFSFTFSRTIGSSFSFSLCPSDSVTAEAPGMQDNFSLFFLHQFIISFHSLTEDTFSHDFLLLLLWLFFLCCSITKQRKTQWNTFVWWVQHFTIMPASVAKAVLQVTFCPVLHSIAPSLGTSDPYISVIQIWSEEISALT